MKILFLVSPNEQAELDRLIVGLTRRGFGLGSKLTVFPFKRNLYETSELFQCYGLPLAGIHAHAGELVSSIKHGSFDVVFVGGTLHWPWLKPMYEYILDAIGDLPCVVLWPDGEAYETAWKFRELNVLCTFDRFKTSDRGDFYLGCGELRERMPASPNTKKQFDTFFAGLSRPVRVQHLNKLRQAGYENLYDRRYQGDYHTYRMMLRHCRANFVFMQDHHLYRRWEGSGQGTCMFIRQSRRLQFRHDYTDGVNAVFYDTPEELLEKLDGVLSSPGQAEALGAAAFEHIINYHLVEHWADYVIEKVEALMP